VELLLLELHAPASSASETTATPSRNPVTLLMGT